MNKGTRLVHRVASFRVRLGCLVVGQIALALACGGPPPSVPYVAPLEIPPLRPDGGTADTGGTKFGHPPTIVGATWGVSTRARAEAVDPSGGSQVTTYASDYRLEVLAVAGPAPSRVRVAFTKNVRGYQDVDTPTRLHGNVYVVDTSLPQVREASGNAAPEDEANLVLDVVSDLGTRARVDQVLPDDAVNIGDRRDDLAGAILHILHPRAWTLRKGSAELGALDGDLAVFKVTIHALSESGLRLTVAGEARVRLRDARLVRLQLEGTYQPPPSTPPSPSGRFVLERTVSD